MPQSLMKDLLPCIPCKEPEIVRLNDPLFEYNNLRIFMLRLDEIHPVLSGNKLFKLVYFLKNAQEATHKKIITFGGAYSNHLAATAFACRQMNIESIGIVRGEEPEILSHTLLFCKKQGMELKFISRSMYKKINEAEYLQQLKNTLGDHVLIPEGGFSPEGKEGASLINKLFRDQIYSHVCLPVGTATTFAGLVQGSVHQTEIIGLGVLKNLQDIGKRFEELEIDSTKKYSFIDGYHFGGYAKQTPQLISFINEFYDRHTIPLDFVYTGKMMFGVSDLAKKGYFPEDSAVLCIHTGGLQGNASLANGMLNFTGNSVSSD